MPGTNNTPSTDRLSQPGVMKETVMSETTPDAAVVPAAASAVLPTGSGAVRPRRRRRRGCLYMLGGLLGLLLILSAGARLYYSDERLRSFAEQELSRALGAKCRIGALSFSSPDMSLELRQAVIEDAAQPAGTEILTLEKLRLDLQLWQSLFQRQLVTDLRAEGAMVRINRTRVADGGGAASAVEEREGRETTRFTTNIHNLLGNITRLPWKNWLTSFDWRLAHGSVSLERGTVQISDQAGVLGPCIFSDLQLQLTRQDDKCQIAVSLKSSSPEAKDGRFSLTAQADIGDPLAGNPQELTFITNLDAQAEFAALDVPYVLRYYGVGGHGRIGWLPGAALDGQVRLQAGKLSELAVKAEVSSPEVIKVLEDGKPLPGGPQVKLSASGTLDISREWNRFQPLQLRLQAGGVPGRQDKSWLDSRAELRGSLDTALVLTSESRMDSGGLADSSLGRLMHLDKSVSGVVKTSLSARLEKDRPLKYNLTASSADLVFHTGKGDAPAPLDLNVAGGLELDADLRPTGGELALDLDAQVLSLHSRQPVKFSLGGQQKPQGMLEVKAELGALCRSLARPLESLGIGLVDESLAGTIALREDGALEWSFSFTRPQLTPVNLLGAGRFGGDGAFALQAALRQSGAVDFLVKGSGKLAAGAFEASFEDQLSAQLDGLYSLRQRFGGLFSFGALPERRLTGQLRQASRGTVSVKGSDFSLALGLSAQANNTAVVGGDALWREKQATLAGSFLLSQTGGDLQLRVDQCTLATASGNLQAACAPVKMSLFRNDVATLATALPAFQVDAELGPVFFARLAALGGERLPVFLRSGQGGQLKVSTAGRGAPLKVDACRLQANGLALNLQPFTFDPGKFAAPFQSGDFRQALAAFSPLGVSMRCGPEFWPALPLPPGLRMDGTLTLAASYDPAADLLNLAQISFAARKDGSAILNAFSGAAEVSHASRLLDARDPATVLGCLEKGLQITRAEISVPALQAFADLQHQATLRALRGRSLAVQNLRLRPVKAVEGLPAGSADFEVSVQAGLEMAYTSPDVKWPLLALAGTVGFSEQFPLRVRVGPGYAGATGTLDLTGTEVRFAALAPYVYQKPARQPSRLAFSLMWQQSGTVHVPAAELSGGPLAVKLTGFEFNDQGNGVFRLQLKEAALGDPFRLTLRELLLDKAANRMVAQVSTPGIDLARLGEQLAFDGGVRLSGSLGATTLQINDHYQSFLGGRGAASKGLGPGNSLKLGALDLQVSARREGGTVRAGLSLDGGEADSGKGQMILRGLKVRKPEGFHYDNPVSIAEIRLQPDTRTLFSDSLVIDRLDIKGLDATLEVGLADGTNITALNASIESLFPPAPAAGGAGPAGADVSAGRKTLIRDLYVDGGTVKLTQKLLMGKAAAPLPLPPLHLQNVGGDDSGTAFSAISQLLLKSIAGSGGTLLKNVGGILSGAAGGTAGAVNNVTSGAGGLLGGLGRTLLRPLGGSSDSSAGSAGTAAADRAKQAGMQLRPGTTDVYEISGVKLIDIAPKLGFDPAALKPVPRQFRNGDMRYVKTALGTITVTSQPRGRDGRALPLDSPEALCAVVFEVGR